MLSDVDNLYIVMSTFVITFHSMAQQFQQLRSILFYDLSCMQCSLCDDFKVCY